MLAAAMAWVNQGEPSKVSKRYDVNTTGTIVRSHVVYQCENSPDRVVGVS